MAFLFRRAQGFPSMVLAGFEAADNGVASFSFVEGF
jgi:hypothetical protein